MKVTILGSGGSLGTPVIGCRCKTCLSTSPLNKRFRSSALVTLNEKNYLIDAGPDYREIALRQKIDRLDGVFLTHYHADHISGLNDLRPYYTLNQGEQIPLFASLSTLDMVKMTYGYLMDRFCPTVLAEKVGTVSIGKSSVRYFSFSQHGVPVTGYRFGKFAYITDIKSYDESVIEAIDGVEVLVLSALNYEGSIMHFSIEEALKFIKSANVGKVYLTHISHKLEHEETSLKLPIGVEIAYDGMEIYLGVTVDV